MTSDILCLRGSGGQATRMADAVICGLRMRPLTDADPHNF